MSLGVYDQNVQNNGETLRISIVRKREPKIEKMHLKSEQLLRTFMLIELDGREDPILVFRLKGWKHRKCGYRGGWRRSVTLKES